MDLDEEEATLLTKQMQDGIRREVAAMSRSDAATLRGWKGLKL